MKFNKKQLRKIVMNFPVRPGYCVDVEGIRIFGRDTDYLCSQQGNTKTFILKRNQRDAKLLG